MSIPPNDKKRKLVQPSNERASEATWENPFIIPVTGAVQQPLANSQAEGGASIMVATAEKKAAAGAHQLRIKCRLEQLGTNLQSAVREEKFKFNQAALWPKSSGHCLTLVCIFLHFRRLGFAPEKIIRLLKQPSLNKLIQDADARGRRYWNGLQDVDPFAYEAGLTTSLLAAEQFVRKIMRGPQDAKLGIGGMSAIGPVNIASPYFRMSGEFTTHAFEISSATMDDAKRGISLEFVAPQRAAHKTWEHHAPTCKDLFGMRSAYGWKCSDSASSSTSTSSSSLVTRSAAQHHAFPLFLLSMRDRSMGDWDSGHAVAIDMGHKNPGIFDPNYGWVELVQGLNTVATWDGLLHRIWAECGIENADTGVVEGGLFAFQYCSKSVGISDDADYVKRYGGLTWSHALPKK